MTRRNTDISLLSVDGRVIIKELGMELIVQ